jgi:diguanylate cyclase (GGDEF)-like protein
VLALAGIVASVLGARAVARSDASQARLSFHLASAEVASSIRLAIQHEEDLVVGASAFVTGDPSASPAGFDRWAESVQAMRRYPELQNLGLVKLVPAARLQAFQARMAANPLRPLGPDTLGPKEGARVLPAGSRPYYCLAVAGLAKSAATYLPGGLDYCALAPTLIAARDSGLSTYAPVVDRQSTVLGVETPVYRGGSAPASATARRRAFVGWLGELLLPNVVLEQAIAGHPNLGVRLRYDSRYSHVAFASGIAPHGAQATTMALRVGRDADLGSREGWTVDTFAPGVGGGVFDNWNSRMLLIGGSLLSVVLGLLLLVLGTGRRRALSMVREKTRELSHQALHDSLTGLPNRTLVLDRAEQIIARTVRHPDTAVGALFIDIDSFKEFNDNLGHASGDRLLRVVAERLQRAAREQDTVGRLGGDEFVVLLESAADEETPNLLAGRLTEVLRAPVELDDSGKLFSVSASIGVASGHYAAPDALLRDADLALYAAKAAGKDRYELFDASMHAGVLAFNGGERPKPSEDSPASAPPRAKAA